MTGNRIPPGPVEEVGVLAVVERRHPAVSDTDTSQIDPDNNIVMKYIHSNHHADLTDNHEYIQKQVWHIYFNKTKYFVLRLYD